MDEIAPENTPLAVVATEVAVVGIVAFGGYQLIKLGVDWTKEGIRKRNAKKTQTQD